MPNDERRKPPLHPDIVKDLQSMGRTVDHVIDPSPGLWGGEPIVGLVTVVYVCPDKKCPYTIGGVVHTHHALYGPRGSDPGSEGMELYAD